MLPLLILWSNHLPPIFCVIGSNRIPTHRRGDHRFFSMISSYFKIKIWATVHLWVHLGCKGFNTPSNIIILFFFIIVWFYPYFLSWDKWIKIFVNTWIFAGLLYIIIYSHFLASFPSIIYAITSYLPYPIIGFSYLTYIPRDHSYLNAGTCSSKRHHSVITIVRMSITWVTRRFTYGSRKKNIVFVLHGRNQSRMVITVITPINVIIFR